MPIPAQLSPQFPYELPLVHRRLSGLHSAELGHELGVQIRFQLYFGVPLVAELWDAAVDDEADPDD